MTQPALAENFNLIPSTSVVQVAWSFSKRVTFRFVFCYFMIYALCCGNATIWGLIPGVGDSIEAWLSWPFEHTSQWLAQNWFHVQGLAGKSTVAAPVIACWTGCHSG